MTLVMSKKELLIIKNINVVSSINIILLNK